MKLKIYNTLTKKVQEIKTDGETVRIYSCGPTVYNTAHIGNLASFIYADILRRAVKLSERKPATHVMNFTDVDDKTIRDSRIRFSNLDPMVALKQLTTEYEEIFKTELREIGNDINELTFVRATENIESIQKLIKKLVKEKVAYVADDGIYFSISEYQKTRKYGQLSKISVGKSRIKNDEYDKNTVGDFALWKAAKDGEPSWDFPKYMKGRPGWHIECSAMSVENLGQPFDIHTGGVDLIFPHHENEIAQSTAGDQPEKLANYFVHSEHLLVDGKKMSKSAGNFYKLSDITDKQFHPLDFRFLVLQSHYQSATNFSWENLEAAHNKLKQWKDTLELLWQTEDKKESMPEQLDEVSKLVDSAITKIFDNLNTREALNEIDKAFAIFNDPNKINHLALLSLSIFCSRELGLSIVALTDDISDEEKNKISQRETARENQDWALSDEIRDELLDAGIELLDSEHGTIWHRA